MKTLDQTIFEMLTENTGRSVCDSGGAYGRNWERNQSKTLADFEREPSATIEVSCWERDGQKHWDISPTVNIFHHLHHALELDSLCREFNALEVGNWNGDYYGTDWNQCQWLSEHGFIAVGDGFNTYNWNSNHSQVLQGQELEHEDSQERYVLLQVHGGCDVRGGYTDAKLFRLPYGIEGVLTDDCGFSVEDGNGDYLSLSWHGEWIDHDGSCPDDDYINLFCERIGEGTHSGDAYPYY